MKSRLSPLSSVLRGRETMADFHLVKQAFLYKEKSGMLS
jgi:hypothetical protein